MSQSATTRDNQAILLDQTSSASRNLAYANRLIAIDILRGLALLIMTSDHTRDFFGSLLYSDADLFLVTPGLFLSRWIAHLCAPIFILLAGVSAYLYGLNHSRKELSLFLLTRGLWLIFLELTVITFAWKFTFDRTLVVQVIYVLGISMIILSALIWLPRLVLLIISLAALIGQQFLANLTPSQPLLSHLYTFIYGYSSFDFRAWNITIFYSIVPWFAVMTLGYWLGPWFKLDNYARVKRFLSLGIFCISVFLILRYFNLFGNPSPWSVSSHSILYTFFSFINVNKYPASLQFLLLMLGIVFLVYPLITKWHNTASRFVLTYGKVSLFFYIIHLYIIHLYAYAYSYFVLHAHPEWWWGNSPWITNHYSTPANYHFELSRVYLVTLLVILIAYPFCLAYGRFKTQHKYFWLSYI
jgi:uncharacterized membrane protein